MPDQEKSKPWVNFRAVDVMRRDLSMLAKMGERSLGWVTRQALRALFRDVESGLLSWSELSGKLPKTKQGSVRQITTVTLEEVTYFRLKSVCREHELTQSMVLVTAVARYLRRRQPMLDGREGYRDSLMESGPALPP